VTVTTAAHVIPLPSQAVTTFGEIATLSAFFACVLFVIVYTAVAPWWRTPMGRNIVSLDLVTALALLPSALHWIFSITVYFSEWYAWFSYSAVGLVPVVIAWRAVILVRLQLRAARLDPSLPVKEEQNG
jgi:hypothetical protein